MRQQPWVDAYGSTATATDRAAKSSSPHSTPPWTPTIPPSTPAHDPNVATTALVEICDFYLAHNTEHTSRGARPHVSYIADLADHPELVPKFRQDAVRIGHVSKTTLQWISCDCAISRVLMKGRSEVLDVGRETRNVPITIWRALVARDGWCDAHHIIPWEDGGPTSLQNLKLLCRRHHREEHFKRRC